MKFNLSGLYEVYRCAILNHEPTLAFELEQGRGRFVFMMFFADEDYESKDQLYLYLKNTNVLLTLKMYGSHRNGCFFIYLNDFVKKKIRAELKLSKQGAPFDFKVFMHCLNDLIPRHVNFPEKLSVIRKAWPRVKHKINHIIDDSEKIYLIGTMKLPEGKKAREKTLRKLYLYVDASPSDIQSFICSLKQSGRTLCWSNDPKKTRYTFSDLILT